MPKLAKSVSTKSAVSKASAVKTSAAKSSASKSCAAKICDRDKVVSFKYYAPQAKKVFVGGGFNDWKPEKHPMKKDSKGNWTVTLKLLPGRYEYRYLVDGVWQNSQEPVECVPNALGSWNCIAEVA
jgi:1,4-alpha-glucan branching enzyme